MAKQKKNPDEPPAEQPAAPAPGANGAPGVKTDPPTEEKYRPVKSFSCPVNGGAVEVAVWGKVIQIDGKDVTVYSVTIHKSYKNELGEWKHTSYLRGSECHVACRLLERAAGFTLDARTEESSPF